MYEGLGCLVCWKAVNVLSGLKFMFFAEGCAIIGHHGLIIHERYVTMHYAELFKRWPCSLVVSSQLLW